MRPCRATWAGTQAPSLPISTKPCGVPLPHYIVHSIAHANRTVCPYPIGVILSIAQGWQVQRSLPWVMMRARRLPPWGLYFSHRTSLPHATNGLFANDFHTRKLLIRQNEMYRFCKTKCAKIEARAHNNYKADLYIVPGRLCLYTG